MLLYYRRVKGGRQGVFEQSSLTSPEVISNDNIVVI